MDQTPEDAAQLLALDLDLIAQLDQIKTELAAVEERALFVKTAAGTSHPDYKQLKAARDQLHLDAQRLLASWVSERAQIAAPLKL